MKKVLCVFLTFLLTFAAFGCGKGRSSSKSDFVNYVFAQDEDFIGTIATDISCLELRDGLMYYMISDVVEGSTPSDKTSDASSSDAEEFNQKIDVRFYKRTLDNEAESEEISGFINEPGTTLVFSTFDVNNNPLLFMKDLSESGKKDIKAYSVENGSLVERDKWSEYVTNSDGENFQRILVSQNKQYIVVFDNSFVILDENLDMISEIKANVNIESIALDKDGNPVIGYTGQGKDSTELKYLVKKYDMKSNSFGENNEVTVDYFEPDTLISGSGEYDFYYTTASALFGYDYSSKSQKKILEFDSSDLHFDADAKYTLCMIDTDNLLFLHRISGGGASETKCQISKYSKVDPDDVDPRMVLTLAGKMLDDNLKTLVNDYNDSQSDYMIKLVDYSEYSDPDGKISADIASGNIPDMFDVSDGIGAMTIDQSISRGYLEDLTPYLENDKDLSVSDFIQPVYNSMLVDNKLYYVAPTFQVESLLAKESEVGSDTHWSYDDFKKYVTSKPDKTRMFYAQTKNDNLNILLNYTIHDFVDWGKGECYFDSPEFMNILEVCDRGTFDESAEEDMREPGDLISSGDMLFIQNKMTADRVEVFEKLFGDKVVYKGYPSKEGTGVYASFAFAIAISSQCDHKDAAWDFIRTMLTDDAEGHIYGYGAVPLREDTFSEYMKFITPNESGKDKYGNEYAPMDGFEVSYHDVTVKVGPYTDEERQKIRDNVYNISGILTKDKKINEIVVEESQDFFSGSKSIDETCDIIQDRVSTYVKENK